MDELLPAELPIQFLDHESYNPGKQGGAELGGADADVAAALALPRALLHNL